jgi:Rod binding domain-containing protein
MNIDTSSMSLSPAMPIDLLSNGSGISGATQPEKLKAACKAIEGLFAGQLMSEMGKGLGGTEESQQSGLYQDFIQQALAQQVTSGGGFGLAKMLESSLTPAKPHLPGTSTHSTHASGAH